MARLEEEAEQADRDDPLTAARQRFTIPEGVVYLDGNSLGALPRGAAETIERCVRREWGEGLVGSWNEAGWYELPLRLGDRLAPIVGAEPGHLVVCDTTTLNLYKALGAALSLRRERRVVLVDGGDFPTNLYITRSALAAAPGAPECVELEPGEDPLARIAALGDRLAAVAMSHVSYRTGAMRDLAAVTAAAHRQGALAVWDLCHSAGAMPLELARSGVDFAVGCTYKYLNGGPGAPAWIYVAPCHLAECEQPLAGWMGHASPFDFEPRHRRHPGIRAFLCGTPHIVSMRGVEAGLATFDGIDLAAVREKSMRLGELFRRAVEAARLPRVELACPADPAARGSQVCFRHPRGYAVVQALIEQRVIGDFRAPDVMRFGFAPLYLRHVEALRAARSLIGCVEAEVWRQERFARRADVT
ncbi:MAG: kynureninase [Acidobacteria bacterium]|nr:MAG: kynureninase [Acidobacteriota bacterium]REK06921.1 MAG: kynureninase [Acidobacteriota bacterium]